MSSKNIQAKLENFILIVYQKEELPLALLSSLDMLELYEKFSIECCKEVFYCWIFYTNNSDLIESKNPLYKDVNFVKDVGRCLVVEYKSKTSKLAVYGVPIGINSLVYAIDDDKDTSLEVSQFFGVFDYLGKKTDSNSRESYNEVSSWFFRVFSFWTDYTDILLERLSSMNFDKLIKR